jgi:dTDP-4-dehydrorhamnose reductase/2-polyprenyl-3-methyl-5-hydroxy-6-metoxy-1,4-benzoquinol methylase
VTRKDAILIVGGDGLIGRALAERLVRAGKTVLRTTLLPEPGAEAFDLSCDADNWTPPRPISVAFLLAAIPSLEFCRTHPAESRAVNVTGTLAVVDTLARQGALVVFPSTNLVFDGTTPQQTADSPFNPRTEYGRQKAEVEGRLRELPEACVVRLTKVLAPSAPLLIQWAAALQAGQPIRPFADMVMAPVPLELVVEAMVRIAALRLRGVVQISATEDITYEQAARHVADRLGADQSLVQPIRAADSGHFFEHIPARTTLDTIRLREELGLTPPSPYAAIDGTRGVPPAIACRLCGATELQEFVDFRALGRVTSDCRPWPAGGRLYQCARCGGVQKIADEAWRRETDAIYAGYAIYHQGEGVEQAVFDQTSGAASSRSQRLLGALRSHVPLPGRGRLLDVGCGNGAMLRAFSQALPGWSLVGTELDDKNRGVIERIEHVERLYTCPPDQVPGAFDAATMIHVLEHIAEPHGFLATVWSKLAPGGLLLVELPHHVANPFELLIADHCTHFAAATATALLEAAGFEVLLTAEDWVPKELTVVARKADGARATAISAVRGNSVLLRDSRANTAETAVARAPSPSVANHLRWLSDIAATARQLAGHESFGLFGTSIAAAWLFGELRGAVRFFVDEDANRVGKTCLDRPIYHPSRIPPGSHVFMPLPPALAESIRRRIAHDGVTFHLPTHTSQI